MLAYYDERALLRPKDIERWASKYRVELRLEHFGTAFLAVSGAFGRV